MLLNGKLEDIIIIYYYFFLDIYIYINEVNHSLRDVILQLLCI